MVQDARIGTEFAGYRIESVLGRGGMSVVYLAQHKRLGRRVALKFLSGDLAQDEDFRARFEQEWQTAAAIDHPNVVPIYEAGEADGVLYIAMRHVGGSLRSLIAREKQLDPARTVLIVAQVASALDAAHRSGLVHRDIKPGNILISPAVGEEGEDHVYLADFGLTKSTTDGGGRTRVGHFVGTLDYVAPEQIEGKPLDARVDIYALGCVMYECLVGTPPYPRESEVAIMHAHLREPPPSILEKRPDVPPGLDAVLAKAMAKAPEDRYPTARAMALAARSAIRQVVGSDFAPTATTPGFRREAGDPSSPPGGTPTASAQIPTAAAGALDSDVSATPPHGPSPSPADAGVVAAGAGAPWGPVDTGGWTAAEPAAASGSGWVPDVGQASDQGAGAPGYGADEGYGGGHAPGFSSPAGGYASEQQYGAQTGGSPAAGGYPGYGAPGYGGGDAWQQGGPGAGPGAYPGAAPPRDRRTLIVAAAVVGVLVVAVGAMLALAGGGGPTPTPPQTSPIAAVTGTPAARSAAPTAAPTRTRTPAPATPTATPTPTGIETTAQHQLILDAIPAAFRDDCFASGPTNPEASAAILCSHEDVLFVSYQRFDTDAELAEAFESSTAIFTEQATGDDCAEGPSQGSYQQGETEDVGRFICYDLAGNATMTWTHDNLRILALTTVFGLEWETLNTFWNGAGPQE